MLRKTRPHVGHSVPEPIASMRPQRNAAENVLRRRRLRKNHAASMRPQRNAAENETAAAWMNQRVGASMRPQRNAAENAVHVGKTGPGSRFNEAAA